MIINSYSLSPPPPTGDPLFSQVGFLIHATGDDDAVAFPDTSPYAHTITPASGAKISTDEIFIGGSTGNFGPTDARISTPAIAAGKIVGDFCLEFDIVFQALGDGLFFMGANGGGTFIWLDSPSGTSARFYFFGGYLTLGSLSVDVKYRICLDRFGSSTKVSVNGVVVSSSTALTADMSTNPTWTFGAAPALAGPGVGGRCRINEIRLTHASRHQTDYTPGSDPFPDE